MKETKSLKKWSCILILVILYCSESLMFREMFSASIRAGIIIAFSLLYFVLAGKGKCIRLKKKTLLVFLLLLSCIILSCLINGFNLTFDLWIILMLMAATVISSSVSYEFFWTSYVDVMAFMGIISAAVFIFYQVFPGLFSVFPNYVWHGNILMKNCYICVVQVNTQFRRNFGIFYEPGMYSVFLILALYFSLFRTKLNFKKIGALLIALATTLSTSGYICAIGLIVAFLLNKQNYSRKAKKHIVILIIIALIVVALFLINNTDALWFLTGKLSEISIKTSVNINDSGSGYERWRSIVYAIDAFLSNPVVGVGYVGWLKIFQTIIATATPINWFGIYGILYGSLMNFFYLKNSIIYTKGKNVNYISTIILATVFMANIISQNMVADLTILILIMYQTSKQNNSICD